MRQKRCFECASAASAIVPIALPNCCIAAAPGETAEAEEIDEQTTGDDNGKSSRGHPGDDEATRPDQLTQIFQHITKLLQYDRVRKLANVRIACTLNATAPALAGSRDIPSARLIAAASLWHSCALDVKGEC